MGSALGNVQVYYFTLLLTFAILFNFQKSKSSKSQKGDSGGSFFKSPKSIVLEYEKYMMYGKSTTKLQEKYNTLRKWGESKSQSGRMKGVARGKKSLIFGT